MRVAFTCPACGGTVSAPPALAGTTGECPRCKASVAWGPAGKRPRPAERDAVMDFLAFRAMLTPVLIQVIFWLGSAACVWVGFGVLLEGKNSRGEFTGNSLVSGLGLIVLGPLVLRVVCELDIVLFKIHDELKSANDRKG